MHVKYRIQHKIPWFRTIHEKEKKNNFTDRKNTTQKKFTCWLMHKSENQTTLFFRYVHFRSYHEFENQLHFEKLIDKFPVLLFFFHVAQRPEMPNHTLRVVYDSFSLRVIYSKYIIWYHAKWYLETKKVQNAEWAKFSRSRALDNDFHQVGHENLLFWTV